MAKYTEKQLKPLIDALTDATGQNATLAMYINANNPQEDAMQYFHAVAESILDRLSNSDRKLYNDIFVEEKYTFPEVEGYIRNATFNAKRTPESALRDSIFHTFFPIIDEKGRDYNHINRCIFDASEKGFARFDEELVRQAAHSVKTATIALAISPKEEVKKEDHSSLIVIQLPEYTSPLPSTESSKSWSTSSDTSSSIEESSKSWSTSTDSIEGHSEKLQYFSSVKQFDTKSQSWVDKTSSAPSLTEEFQKNTQTWKEKNAEPQAKRQSSCCMVQ